ncbi:MAG: hypothetical protein ACSHYA_09865 [Opitutaceae bacterium]
MPRPQSLDLNLKGASTDLLHVEVKHLYGNEAGEPVLEHYTTGSLPSLTLGASATAVLKYSYRTPVTIDEQSTERKYYATSYLRKISAGAPVEFNINDVDVSAKQGEAVLRVGLGRKHGLSLHPEIRLNGQPIEDDWRGYDQWNRGQFFGVLEIPVRYSQLQKSNTIEVSFPDTGGHISSMAMQVFGFSSEIR